MKRNKSVMLEITSWAGMSLGAEHFYGHLCGYTDKEGNNYQKIELEKKMTSNEAKLLNEKDSSSMFKMGFRWKRGDLTTRFNTREEIIELAIKTFKEHFPDAEILFQGRFAVGDPCNILVAPEPQFSLGMKLYKEAVEIDYYENDYDRMIKISDEWDALWKEIN